MTDTAEDWGTPGEESAAVGNTIMLCKDDLLELIQKVRAMTDEELVKFALAKIADDPISLLRYQHGLSPDEYNEIREHVLAWNKVLAIKAARNYTGMGLRDAKEFVETKFKDLWDRPRHGS